MRPLRTGPFALLVALLGLALLIQYVWAPAPEDPMAVYERAVARMEKALPLAVGDWQRKPKARQVVVAPGRDVNATYFRKDGFWADVILSTRSAKQESCFINGGTLVLRGPESLEITAPDGARLKAKLLIVRAREGGAPAIVVYTYLDASGATTRIWWWALLRKKAVQIYKGEVENVFLRVASYPTRIEQGIEPPLEAAKELLGALSVEIKAGLRE